VPARRIRPQLHVVMQQSWVKYVIYALAAAQAVVLFMLIISFLGEPTRGSDSGGREMFFFVLLPETLPAMALALFRFAPCRWLRGVAGAAN
jgi:hypothetical protein